LEDANLKGANLAGATITEKQLDSCESLEGATMPDGTKHPDQQRATSETRASVRGHLRTDHLSEVFLAEFSEFFSRRTSENTPYAKFVNKGKRKDRSLER
jgi:uncharacterized protein YjbI with pentapeptide repeats